MPVRDGERADQPEVTIGMPVYNGAAYLREALDCVVNQTYRSIEVVISDNGSTDDTELICREYAERDDRVRYHRSPVNRGAAWNFNTVVERARGRYFKWAAHDDLCAPDFVERCVAVLESDPSVVLCSSWAEAIDDKGSAMHAYDPKPELDDERAWRRYYHCICVPHPQVAVFGVFRMDVLRQTSLIGCYSSSDRVLLGEVALRGRIHEIPDRLFGYRNQPGQSWRAYPRAQQREEWFDPRRKGMRTRPHWRLLVEHWRVVSRVPLSRRERLACRLVLLWWLRLHWRMLLIRPSE